MNNATGKIIVLTGVTRGLGRALTEAFIQQGHTVIGCARTAPIIEDLARQYPAPHDFAVVDVAVESQVKQWASHSLKQHGPPDFLLNNAALINHNAPLWKITAKEFSTVIDVNLKGIANTVRYFVPSMIERASGVIINFSSGWGHSADPEVAPYCATKWGVEGLTQALAQELPAGLAAVALNPGIINTEMLQSCFGTESASKYPTATEWAKTAAPFILSFNHRHNGQSPTVPH